MNYYSNGLYPNFQYPNNYQQNQYLTQPQMNNFNLNSYRQGYQMGLQGKIVDGEDIVKATEIPLGSFGVFPKADLNEIYVKTWNNDGTTQIIKYQPIVTTQVTNDVNSMILDKLNEIENKIGMLATPATTSTTTPEISVEKLTAEKRKEIDISAY